MTVFPHNDGDDWTAGGLKALHAPGLADETAQPVHDRDSTVTVFPRGVPSAYYANRPKEVDQLDANKQPMSSDMSWLDLGGGGNRILSLLYLDRPRMVVFYLMTVFTALYVGTP